MQSSGWCLSMLQSAKRFLGLLHKPITSSDLTSSSLRTKLIAWTAAKSERTLLEHLVRFECWNRVIPLLSVWCQKWRPSLASYLMLFGWIKICCELRININKQDLRPRENIWRLPGLWLSWPNIFPELVQVGKRHQEPYVGLVDLWFPGAPLFSFDRAQAAPFERQPLKMARTSPKAKAGVSPRRIGLQPIDTGNGLRT